jgi:glutamate racemase
MNKNSPELHPIGVFDSGVGGLTVVRALMERLPFENILYFGDTARVPYGVKTVETINAYARRTRISAPSGINSSSLPVTRWPPWPASP